MRFTRWLNPMQPQTLQIATMLFYINAVFDVLYGLVLTPVGLVVTLGSVVSGLGIANGVKWGYKLAVVVAALGLVPFALVIVDEGAGVLVGPFILNLIFPLALFALLVHPHSRDYQRLWFE
jgi:hypothetical protein